MGRFKPRNEVTENDPKTLHHRNTFLGVERTGGAAGEIKHVKFYESVHGVQLSPKGLH